MAIKQCSNVFHKIKVNGKTYENKSWACTCDGCGAEAKPGIDAGQAHEKAWFAGFRPVSAGTTRAMRWHCPDCLNKRKASVKANGNGLSMISV